MLQTGDPLKLNGIGGMVEFCSEKYVAPGGTESAESVGVASRVLIKAANCVEDKLFKETKSAGVNEMVPASWARNARPNRRLKHIKPKILATTTPLNSFIK